MAQRNLLIGILGHGQKLEVDNKKILLTRIPPQSAQSPESAPLEISPEDVGRLAILRGELSGDVLYSAEIMEILPDLTGALFKNLLGKGILSMDDLKEQLSEIVAERKGQDVKKKLCALVIGHKKSSPGAINKNTGLTEFEFNEELARRIEKRAENVDIQRVYRRTYAELPADINALGPDFIVSLHCNAFNGQASGTEVLYYHRSETGRRMAEVLLKHLVECLKLPDRGIKPKTAEDRGGYLLRYTKAPCVISEPFFIDNDDDLAKAEENLDALALAYARAIEEITDII
ncbi:MAG: N-acetylmuramoyl-L-alanine amidase [Nitrospirae bacterium]|nr:N-acetylmuramoyl-L-alanine amidase [Nitrospirota bacterium]